ncbi:hypothetical protein E2C01_087033 [Portunus trituberculatus]|uniref:Uncharacterized protein n=1 Tax=Portunus trituberculatus TaxID=210409 RepID=A0A5B7JCZ8_PORTR|nr:hypothetical protein [Portunus trituberculatus]
MVTRTCINPLFPPSHSPPYPNPTPTIPPSLAPSPPTTTTSSSSSFSSSSFSYSSHSPPPPLPNAPTPSTHLGPASQLNFKSLSPQHAKSQLPLVLFSCQMKKG